jgi:hypothetical protein
MRLLSLTLVSTLLVPMLARAQQPAPGAPDNRAAEAKQHYETGMAHFQLEEWDQAIEEWQAGFRAKPVSQFLYNIAQAYRQSKRYDKALNYYQKYLRMDPHAANKAEVDRHIAALTASLEQEKKTQAQPPVAPMPVKGGKTESASASTAKPGETTTAPGETATTTPPPTTPPPTTTPPPANNNTTLTAKAPEKQPITKRKWFWPVVGAAAGVVVIAIVVGAAVGASGGGDDTKVLPLARF